MASINLRAVSFVVFLFAWFGTAYRLPHGKWNSKDVGEGVGNTKSDGGEPVDAATTGAGKSSGDIFAQREQLKNKEGAKPLVGEVHGAVMKERDSDGPRYKRFDGKMVQEVADATGLNNYASLELLRKNKWNKDQAIAAHRRKRRTQEKTVLVRQAKIDNVMNVAGISSNKAEAYLDSYGFNESKALNAYFDGLITPGVHQPFHSYHQVGSDGKELW